jgi:CPA2 family monovalent cation:H+ antiporter-2
MHDHVVVVGYGRVGEHVMTVLERLGVPRLVVEQDAARAVVFQQRGIATLFGDAANSEILSHAGLGRARALVVTVPSEAAAELIVVAARRQAPDLPIIVRAASKDGVKRLLAHGGCDVIHPELEGGLEIVRHTLLALDYPPMQVEQYTQAVRQDGYDTAINSHEEHRMLEQLLTALGNISVAWHRVSNDSQLVNRSLAAVNLRAQSGASVISVRRDQTVIPNPKSSFIFAAGDLVGVIGDAEQVRIAGALIASTAPSDDTLHAPGGAQLANDPS